MAHLYGASCCLIWRQTSLFPLDDFAILFTRELRPETVRAESGEWRAETRRVESGERRMESRVQESRESRTESGEQRAETGDQSSGKWRVESWRAKSNIGKKRLRPKDIEVKICHRCKLIL